MAFLRVSPSHCYNLSQLYLWFYLPHSLLVDIFYWPPTTSPTSSLMPFSSLLWQFSHCFAVFLQRHCVSLYRQCIRRAFRQRLLDNILPSCCCCCCCWGLPLCVFIRRMYPSLDSVCRCLWLIECCPLSGSFSYICCWFLCTSLNALCWPHVNAWYMAGTVEQE